MFKKVPGWKFRVVGLLLCLPLLGFAESITYEDTVRPLFKKHCLNCHNPDKKKADLDLSTFAGVLAGGSGGGIVKAGVPDSSILYMAVAHEEDVEPMPPKKPRISEVEMLVVRNWIQQGLVERSGGASRLRKIEFEVAAGSGREPKGPPPMPESLPEIQDEDLVRPPVIRAMAASPWAPLVAVAGFERILFYHTEDKAWLGAVPFAEGTVYDLKFSRNGRILVAAGGRGAHSGKVVLFEVESGRRVAEIGDEEDVVLSADLSSDHRFTAFGTPNKLVKIHETKTGKLLHRIKKHTDWVTSVSFRPEGDWVATGDRNGGIHIWEAEKGAIVYSLSDHKVCITDLSWRSDGKMLGSAADDGKLVLWDMSDGWPAKVVDAHRSKTTDRYTRGTGILSMHWARTGEIVTSGRDRRVRLWKANGQKLKEWKPLAVLPTSVELIRDSAYVLVGGFDGRLRSSSIVSAGEMEIVETERAFRSRE